MAGSRLAPKIQRMTLQPRNGRPRSWNPGVIPPILPGVLEPASSRVLGRDIRIPHTRQIDEQGYLANLLSIEVKQLGNTPETSALGHLIDSPEDVDNPSPASVLCRPEDGRRGQAG